MNSPRAGNSGAVVHIGIQTVSIGRRTDGPSRKRNVQYSIIHQAVWTSNRASKIPTKRLAGVVKEGYPAKGVYSVNTTKSKEIFDIKYRGFEESLVGFVKSWGDGIEFNLV